MELKNKHILITGAARRVGRAIADHLLQWDIRLTAHFYRSKKEAQSLVIQAETQKRAIFCDSADLREVSEIKSLVEKSQQALGPIDILINCASAFYPTPLLQCSEMQWDDIMQANLKGQFFMAQASAQQMSKRGGLIINIADTHASIPMKNYSAYCISKAGLVMMTKQLALELAPAVRVNTVSPGPVLWPEDLSASVQEKSVAQTLLKRMGCPKDVIDAICFLIQNDYVTGQNLVVDGGRSLV
ncbi:MAG: SDR family oxidoreductase [Deltaproteobacteria bacterium]|nr:SDR family oxidoreductase [Deltaproteobacteria bacterium]